MTAADEPTERSMWTIDPRIQRLVDALNTFEGIETIGSCGGHPEPLTGGQWPEGTWYVKFRVAKNAHGWRALEFLAWLINNAFGRQGHPRHAVPDRSAAVSERAGPRARLLHGGA